MPRSRPARQGLRIILKTDVSGSLGAINSCATATLDRRSPDQRPARGRRRRHGQRHHARRGHPSNAIVVAFSTKVTDTARRAAEAEKVDVRQYDIIYKLTDDIQAALRGLLEPVEVETVEGRAEVRQIFRVGKSAVIAGCYVTDGRIVRSGSVRVWRGGKVIATRPDQKASAA